MSTARLVLAVDGGGTTTTACLASRPAAGAGVVLGEATAGQSNPAVVGLETCQKHIRAAVTAAQANANQTGRNGPDYIVIGLAGIEATDFRKTLRAWAITELSAGKVDVITDIELLLMAAAGDRATVGLISGTGSVAVGRDTSGKLARSGGRGFLIGDAGSGFWIGQRGVTAAIRGLDAIGPETLLVEAVAAQLGTRDPAAWTNHVYGNDRDPRSVLASFAPVVLAAAEQQDQVALEIVDQAGVELAELVLGVARQLDLVDHQFDLIMAGGVLVNQPSLRDTILVLLEQVVLRPAEALVVAHPAQAVAERLCQVGAAPDQDGS